VFLDDGQVAFQGTHERMSVEQRQQLKGWPAACQGCREKQCCSGIYSMYLEVHGNKEFKPL
jgi:hypothetical protein